MASLPSVSRDHRRFAWFAACGLAFLTLPPPAAAQEGTTLRSVQIPGFGALRFPAPTAWRIGPVEATEAPADGTDGQVTRGASFQVTPDGDSHSEMTVSFSWSEMPDPAFNGPAALRALVERMGSAALDESIEAHYLLREMRSPHGGGYWFTLRARAPRRKSQGYLTSGAFGFSNALLRFTFLAPQPDLPEAAAAIDLITGARIDDEPAPAP